MLDALKQVGILLGDGKHAEIKGENVKIGYLSQMNKAQLEEFCQPLEILLVLGAEQEDSLVENCPCALLWFAEKKPAVLEEKYDAAFVKTAPQTEEAVLKAFAMLAQETLSEGFDVFGEVESIVSRFTDFTLVDSAEDDTRKYRLLLWLGSGIGVDSEEQDRFLQISQQLSKEAQRKRTEFFCSYSLARGKEAPALLLFTAVEKKDEE